MSLVVAIDPGAKGGLAVFHRAVRAERLPQDPVLLACKLARLFNEGREDVQPPVLAVELVGGYVKGRPAPGSGMFKFGHGAGVAVGIGLGVGFAVCRVRPQEWQARLGLGTSAQAGGKAPWKRLLQTEAARRFPHLKVTAAIGDALLIGDYVTEALQSQPIFLAAPDRILNCSGPGWLFSLSGNEQPTKQRKATHG